MYKAVPGLQARERGRIEDFYKQRNLPIPDGEAYQAKVTPVLTNGDVSHEDKNDKGADCNYHRDDTQVEPQCVS